MTKINYEPSNLNTGKVSLTNSNKQVMSMVVKLYVQFANLLIKVKF